MNSTEGKPYEQKESLTKTSGSAAKKGKEVIDSIADTIDKMHIKKLFFILLIAGYCIIAFSKGQRGVSMDDLRSYISFIIFSLVVYSALHFFEEKYGDDIDK